MKKIRKTIFIIILIIFSVSVIYVCEGYNMYKEALEKVSLEDKIKEIQSKKTYTKIDEMPDIYLNAVLAVEDHRFYEHSGIDIIAICRAILNDIQTFSFAEGGSTITQQLAKNIYFTQDKTIQRKVAEVFMAFELEQNLEKNEILELYLNTSYFGDGYYTVKEAANGYFNKEPKAMNKYESTLLAGIPNAPAIYAPTKNLELSKQRQKQVMNKMIKFGYLTKEESIEILKLSE